MLQREGKRSGPDPRSPLMMRQRAGAAAAACLGASVVFHVASPPVVAGRSLHLGWLFMRCRI